MSFMKKYRKPIRVPPVVFRTLNPHNFRNMRQRIISPIQSKPDITRGSGMKNRARSIDSRSIEKQWLRYGRKEIFKKRDFFQIKC